MAIEIYTGQDLDNIRNDLTADYILMNDIDLLSWGEWTPIGNMSTPFTGTFDGQDYIINHLYISSAVAHDDVGLFGVINQTVLIQNLNLINVDITTTGTGPGAVGGLTGKVLPASLAFSILNVKVTGSIVSDSNYVGILSGFLDQANVQNTSTYGSVVGSANIGGLIGNTRTAIVEYSFSHASAIADVNAGSLIGVADDTYVLNCYAIGNAQADNNVGGLIGQIFTPTYRMSPTYVTNCYSIGEVVALVGDKGGLIGGDAEDTGSVTDSYWNTETSNTSTSFGGTGKTTEEMKIEATYINWNFTNTWNLIPQTSYPFLRSNLAIVEIIINQYMNIDGIPIKVVHKYNQELDNHTVDSSRGHINQPFSFENQFRFEYNKQEDTLTIKLL